MEDKLRAYVAVLSDILDAHVVACWSVSAGELELRAQVGLDQTGLDVAADVWRSQRSRLQLGHTVRIGGAVVWPLVESEELVGLLYVDRLRDEIGEEARMAVKRISRWLVVSPTAGPPTPVAAGDDAERRQLIVALRRTGGSVAGAARLLGVARQTVYTRMDRWGIQLDSFRA